MKGKNEITDAAAVALVTAYKQHELYMVQSDERGERTDGWKKSREKWEAITTDLNTRFELSISTDQWKKKLSNIKTNVKRKSTEKCDETDSSRRVNWSLAELEYDRLFPSRSSNSPNEMETYTASENNYRAVNTEPSCSMNLGASINEHVLANLTSQLIDDVDSISDIKNIIVSNSMNDKKNKLRGMKRKQESPASPMNSIKQTAPNSILSAASPFMITPNIAADSNTAQKLSMFMAAQQQFNNMFLNNNDGFMTNNNKKNKVASNIYQVQLQAANCYLEAANIQKRAAEQFMQTVTKLTNTVDKFETLVSIISNRN